MRISYSLSFLLTFSLVFSCNKQKPKETPRMVYEDVSTFETRAAALMEELPVELYDGMSLELWASDSLAPDPIAMSIDDGGNVYLTRTNRQKNSEFDIRGYRQWMTPSIGFQTVEDRREFLHAEFAPERSEENAWLADLNQDGSHDWRDLAVEKDELWKLSDTNNDGIADVAKIILEDFNTEVTDVANALLVRENDVFVGIGPDMWRLQDTNEDEVLDEKTSISTGYAVHIGFSGHGMSGAIQGPDGRIYWGIGDIGANITDLEGNTYKFPNQGVIVRSEPDGSNFEVFAHGLRNTHEFVFDPYGNIISSDNDGDHPGESERLVHIVEGSDAGWRSNWQYGKYTDPRNNSYKVWMEERLYLPRWEGQAAYIIPPIQNYHNGPTGMEFNPGTAFGPEWKDHFFLVEFAGNPTRSAIWAFTLQPNGASFTLEQEKKLISGILPTGIRFGPDGAMYAADWVNGWGTKDYGRVWKLDVDNIDRETQAVRERTKELIQMEYSSVDIDELKELLSYADMRVRQKAQFELARRQEADAFLDLLSASDNQLARIHSIWGYGQLIRSGEADAGVLIDYLSDQDTEIIAQAARQLGDVRYGAAADALLPLLTNPEPRVRFFGAEALGRIGYAPATDALVEMLEENNDEDIYLRHAAVLALSRVAKASDMKALSSHPSKAVRTGAVLVLRRLSSPDIAVFLKDADEYIVTEAARAINDDFSIEPALPDLARVLEEDRFTSEALLRRAINAALRVGDEYSMNLLISFVRRPNIEPQLIAEGIAALGTWANPSVLDRVDGRYRGEVSRDPMIIRTKMNEIMGEFLGNSNTDIVIASLRAITELKIEGYDTQVVRMTTSHPDQAVRATALNALAASGYNDMSKIVAQSLKDPGPEVRGAAIAVIPELDFPADQLSAMIAPIFESGDIREQQELLRVVSRLPESVSNPIITDLTEQLVSGDLNPSLRLDISEVVEEMDDEDLSAKLASVQTGDPNSTEAYAETLYGGDRFRGWRIFNEHPAAQCTRCHAFDPNAEMVGPALAGIGNELTREQLLEALIEPSARIAPGYGTVTVTMSDGQKITGVLIEESAEELVLKTSEAEPLHLAKARISDRINAPSGMPPMGTILTRREIRDLVQFLSELD